MNYISLDGMKNRIGKNKINLWCSKLDDVVAGVVAMRPPCAVSLLFVDKKHHKKGIAKSMFKYALKAYLNDNI